MNNPGHTTDPNPPRTVASIPDDMLLQRAMLNIRPAQRKTARWALVMDTFALGSTFAHQLCHRFGLDPDDELKVRR